MCRNGSACVTSAAARALKTKEVLSVEAVELAGGRDCADRPRWRAAAIFRLAPARAACPGRSSAACRVGLAARDQVRRLSRADYSNAFTRSRDAVAAYHVADRRDDF